MYTSVNYRTLMLAVLALKDEDSELPHQLRLAISMLTK